MIHTESTGSVRALIGAVEYIYWKNNINKISVINTSFIKRYRVLDMLDDFISNIVSCFTLWLKRVDTIVKRGFKIYFRDDRQS